MIQKNKKFEWPRKLYDKVRIEDENKIVSKYGLKNKKEIWKTEAKVKYFRERAKSLVSADQDEQRAFFDKLNKIGLRVNSIADVLALGTDDLMVRRLTHVVVNKGLATTPKQARQMIVHKKIMIGENLVSVPSYIVRVDEEKLISVKKKPGKVKVVEQKNEEVKVDERVSEKIEGDKNE